jgi:hypothetical protein
MEVQGRVRAFPDRLDFEVGTPPGPVEKVVRLEAIEGVVEEAD